MKTRFRKLQSSTRIPQSFIEKAKLDFLRKGGIIKRLKPAQNMFKNANPYKSGTVSISMSDLTDMECL